MSDDRPQAPSAVESSLSADQQSAEVVVGEGLAPDVPPRWRSAWQLPLLACSLGLIGLGLWTFKAPPEAVADPAELLAAAASRMHDGHYAESRQLHDQASALIGAEDDRLRAELLVGRADLESRRPSGDRDHERILEHYDQALALGRELELEQQARRAAALAGVGAYAEAFTILLDGVGGEPLERVRTRILKSLVDDGLGGDVAGSLQLAAALDRYAAEPGRSLERSCWAALSSGRLRLSAGDVENGIDAMQRSMRRLDVSAGAIVDADWKARMYAVYGRLWLEVDDRDAARGALEIAVAELAPGDDDRRRAAAGLAWIDFADGLHGAAITRFDEIIASNPEAGTMEQVRLWRAEAHAALGAFEASAEDYLFLLGRFDAVGEHFSRRLLESVGDRVRESMVLGDPGQAILFAEMVVDSAAFGFNEELLGSAAAAHRELGEVVLRTHSDEIDLMAIPHDVVPEPERRRASTHFRRAGELYARIAARYVGDTGGREIWVTMQRAAAECYDLGAHATKTIEAYQAYLEATSSEDLERAHVAFRYARVLHASGRFEEALAAYDDLVRVHESMPEAVNKARVDAARCLMVLGRTQEARARLESIVSGLPKGLYPDSIGFRDAKFVLGRLYSDTGDWSNAISTLSEVLRRYPDDSRMPEAAFDLAHAHKQSAAKLEVELADEALTPSRRRHLNELNERHLEGASEACDLVVVAYDAMDPSELEPIERERLRDAAITRADCAFDLGDDERAVTLYEGVERRYRKETTSLGALIRLVETWDRLGNARMADKVHRQAELRLKQLPEEAFTFPESRFDRERWRIWIERRPLRGMRVEAGE
jgi:tetratricopeptide (TPR) repeat protein